MDTQYKILFLKNLIDSAIARINTPPLHQYRVVIDTTNGNLSVKVTYNDLVVFNKQHKNLNLGEIYVELSHIVEMLISSEILTCAAKKNKGSINITSGNI